jgi:arginyl-tRNA synthetase
MIMLPPEILAEHVRRAIVGAQDAGDLAQFEVPVVTVHPPRRAEFGDLSTPVCLQMARPARRPPLEIAGIVANHLVEHEMIGDAQVTPPGFINFTFSPAWLTQQVEEISAAGTAYGRADLGKGKRIQVEYGSANPVGPLHVGFGRNVVLGDGIANVLSATGYDVQREYYVNDALTQVETFGASLYARYAQLLGDDVEFPKDGYQGQYIVEWAQEIIDAHGDRYLYLPRADAEAQLRDIGLQKALKSIRADCDRLQIHYDSWFSEKSLYEGETYDRISAILRDGDFLYEKDGAIWFKAEELGGDKDEVFVRSSGLPGYFASDIAYHYDKFMLRGFEWVIDVWGADHQGHVPRMHAMMRALDLDPDALSLLIYQMVTIIQGGENVVLSKRRGTLVFLSEILDDVGADATRFFLLQRSADSQMDFDVDLAKKQSDENPVYYVQYAHARIASVLRTAQERGWTDWSDGNVELLTHPKELGLIRKMIQLPEVVIRAATELAPHHLCYYAQDLAGAFHSFYQDCRVVSSDPDDVETTKARLKLVGAAKQVLANTLRTIGVDTPERM